MAATRKGWPRRSRSPVSYVPHSQRTRHHGRRVLEVLPRLATGLPTPDRMPAQSECLKHSRAAPAGSRVVGLWPWLNSCPLRSPGGRWAGSEAPLPLLSGFTSDEKIWLAAPWSIAPGLTRPGSPQPDTRGGLPRIPQPIDLAAVRMVFPPCVEDVALWGSVAHSLLVQSTTG
jgi:hypothetical protein